MSGAVPRRALTKSTHELHAKGVATQLRLALSADYPNLCEQVSIYIYHQVCQRLTNACVQGRNRAAKLRKQARTGDAPEQINGDKRAKLHLQSPSSPPQEDKEFTKFLRLSELTAREDRERQEREQQEYEAAVQVSQELQFRNDAAKASGATSGGDSASTGIRTTSNPGEAADLVPCADEC